MKDLFYSHHEGILFYIGGYEDTTNVKTMISILQNNYNFFEKLAKVKEIHTDVITKSSRYKNMRVYWAVTSERPIDAFVIGANDSSDNLKKWTMRKWLEN